jgi:DNA-binding winged helix-turn-helix (wHTH) protein
VRFSIMRDVPAVFAHGKELKVGGNLGRILRLLLLARGRAVTKNDLALEFNGIRPTSVESIVSRLRTAIRDTDHTIIVSTAADGRGGYLIDQAVVDVDAFLFEEVANAPAVAGAVSFEATDNEFGQMAAGLMDTWRIWHSNPAPEVTNFDFAEQAYHDFAYMHDRLGRAVAYSVLRRWLLHGKSRDLTDAITFLNKLVVGDQTDEEVWALLLRAEGSQPSWQRGVPALFARLEKACDEVPDDLRALHRRILARDEAVLLVPAGARLVDIGPAESTPLVGASEFDRGNLIDLAQMVGLSSNSALRLRNSRVEPRECIEQTVQRLWFLGIFASKWVTEPQVRNQFETLLDRLDGDDDASVHFLLLDPKSESFGRFQSITQTTESPQSFTWLRALSKRHRSFKVRVYDSLPTFRIIVIDDSLVTVAPYMNVPQEWLRERGWESPHIVLAPMAPFPLAKSFELMFRESWRRSRPLEHG